MLSPRSIDEFAACEGPSSSKVVEGRRRIANDSLSCTPNNLQYTYNSSLILTDRQNIAQEIDRSLRDDLDWPLEQLHCTKLRYGDNHQYTIKPLNYVGNVYYRRGHLDNAMQCYQKALEIGIAEYKKRQQYPPGMMAAMNNIAAILYFKGRRYESLQTFALALQLQTHEGAAAAEVDVLQTLRVFADIHSKRGNEGEARILRQEIGRMQRIARHMGDDRIDLSLISSLLTTICTSIC